MSFAIVAVAGVGAAVSAGASIYGSTQQDSAAKGAAAAQQDAMSHATQTTLAGGRGALAYLDPFRQYGLNAGLSLQDALYSPEQKTQQIATQRAKLQGEVDRQKALAPKWETYQMLSGKGA